MFTTNNEYLNKILQDWVCEYNDEFTSLFDFEYLNLQNISTPNNLFATEIQSSKPILDKKTSQQPSTAKKKKDSLELGLSAEKNKPQTQESSRISSQIITDYSYYEYKVEKLPIDLVSKLEIDQKVSSSIPQSSYSAHKQSRDEHIDIEISTKSEEILDDTTEAIEKSTIEEKIEIVETTDVSVQPKQTKTQKRRKRNQKTISDKSLERNSSKLQTKVYLNVPIEPYQGESIFQFCDPSETRNKAKLAEKMKKDSKEVLRDQLLKVEQVDNLDEFEKICIVEINSFESLSKKMKQKARKRLKASIITEKVKRNIAVDQIEEECDDDEVEDEDNSLRERYINYTQLIPEENLQLIISQCSHQLTAVQNQKLIFDSRSVINTKPNQKKAKPDTSQNNNDKGGKPSLTLKARSGSKVYSIQ